VCRRRLPGQAVARSDGAVDTLRLKDEGEVAGPLDITGWGRNIQPEHASWTREGGPGKWQRREGLSPAGGGADARRGCIGAFEPAAVLVGVVNGELQRACSAGPRDVAMKTDAHDRERLRQDLVIDQDAVRAAAGAGIGDQVPGRPIRVRAVDSRTADVPERDKRAAVSRRFGGLRNAARVVRRKR
jgi:hypothetical protein